MSGLNSTRLSFVVNKMSLSRVLLRTATVSRGTLSSRILLVRPALRASYSVTTFRDKRIVPARPALRASYSASAGGLSRDVIQTRILDVLKGFEKVDQSKVAALLKSHAHF